MSESVPEPPAQLRLRDYVLSALAVVFGVTAVLAPFARDAFATNGYVLGRGLTPATDPIPMTTAPILFWVVGIGLLLAASGWLLGLPRVLARRLAVGAAGLKAAVIGLIGAGLIASAYAQPPNTDGLLGLALLFLGVPILIGGLVYVGVAFLVRARRMPWRMAAAALDAFVAWSIAQYLLQGSVTNSQPYTRDPRSA